MAVYRMNRRGRMVKTSVRAMKMRSQLRRWSSDGLRWRAKQHLAGDSRYYGDGGTIHHSGELDVEIWNGDVVAVWFRCQMLPFKQHEVGDVRARSMRSATDHLPELTGVEVRDVSV